EPRPDSHRGRDLDAEPEHVQPLQDRRQQADPVSRAPGRRPVEQRRPDGRVSPEHDQHVPGGQPDLERRAIKGAESLDLPALQVLGDVAHAAPLVTALGPVTTAPAGTSLVTTAQAPTIAPSPMVTPFRMVARAPIQTPSPMRTGRLSRPRPGSGCWSVSMISTSQPIMQSRPIA